MSKHTPGPWVMDTIRTSVGICHRIGPFPPRRPDDETVRHACLYADYPSAFNPADEELEANARLIAAAPDLLTDLREAAATLRRYEELHRAKGTAESTAKAEVNAELASRFEATIAKATAA